MRDLQRAVLAYLVEHLEAKDTVEGIMQWWLPRAHAAIRMADVISALEDLVVRGWLTATSLHPGVAIYGLDRTRVEEVREFLERRGAP